METPQLSFGEVRFEFVQMAGAVKLEVKPRLREAAGRYTKVRPTTSGVVWVA